MLAGGDRYGDIFVNDIWRRGLMYAEHIRDRERNTVSFVEIDLERVES